MKPSILIVDDERDIRNSLSRYLSNQYNTFSASNGCEAINIIRDNHDIKLIISDIEMPEMDGIELLMKINEYKLDIPTIFLSGSSIVNAEVDAMRLGAYDYLTKPVDMDCLERSIKSAVHRCHACI